VVSTSPKNISQLLSSKSCCFFISLASVALVTLTRPSHSKLSQLPAVTAHWNDEPVGGNQQL